tara:strand:- start:314 stop:613 length:300 start_codon:yes stop_codon:yes gene_type:complete
LRDKTDLRFRAFADAASVRSCGVDTAAVPRTSPNQTLKTLIGHRSETALSSKKASTRMLRTLLPFDQLTQVRNQGGPSLARPGSMSVTGSHFAFAAAWS